MPQLLAAIDEAERVMQITLHSGCKVSGNRQRSLTLTHLPTAQLQMLLLVCACPFLEGREM